MRIFKYPWNKQVLLDAHLDLVLIVLLLHLAQLFSYQKIPLEFMAFLSFLFDALWLLPLFTHPLLGKISYPTFGWLDLVWDHVVATKLRMVLHFFKPILLAFFNIVREELLDSGCLVLVLITFIGKDTERAELLSHDEAVSILRELTVQWVVHHILIN